MDADKKRIWVSGRFVEVTDEVYNAYMKGDRKMRYFESDLKAERFLMDENGQIRQAIPSREDSLDRLIDFPTFGSILCTGHGAALRMTSVRDMYTSVLDIVLPGTDEEDGTVRIPAGPFSGEIEFSFRVPIPRKVRADAPDIIRQAVEKFELTALPFRADVSTFTNNGGSMGAPICLDVWSEIASAIGDSRIVPTSAMLKSTLELWMLGQPSYASGWSNDHSHRYEEEYLMTGAAGLVGLGRWLCRWADRKWYDTFRSHILEKLLAAKELMQDGDGLILSTYRKGISGEAQWSTAWADVTSFGWKDAWSNALLYRALQLLEEGFARFGDAKAGALCRNWSSVIKENYWDTFRTENGWAAGWRCAENKLHDHAFLVVNGLAASCGLIPEEEAKGAIEGLWNALLASGFDGFERGLPLNVWCIPNEDMAAAQHTCPFGGYQNAGITLSQSCAFLRGMLSVGMDKEAKWVLEQIAGGLCDGLTIGGVHTGVDWQTWDGVASGYEGYLCDQMGVLALMLDIWGE